MGCSKVELSALIEELWNPLADGQIAFLKPVSPALIDVVFDDLKGFGPAVIREALRGEIRESRPDIRRVARRCGTEQPRAGRALAALLADAAVVGARYAYREDSPFWGPIVWQSEAGMAVDLRNARYPDRAPDRTMINDDTASWGWSFDRTDARWHELVAEYRDQPDPMIALRAALAHVGGPDDKNAEYRNSRREGTMKGERP